MRFASRGTSTTRGPIVADRMPKSVIFTSPSGVITTLVGDNPRCVSPRPCA
jgi:hypothetical protein